MNNLLITDASAFFEQMAQFTSKLNQQPEKDWIATHDGWDYLPVSIIETELAQLFKGLHKFELLTERTQKEEQIITARIHYFHPVAHEWMFHDGVGSAYLDYAQVNPLKTAGALAYSEAIKVASKKFGKRFGSDLNRKETGDYDQSVVKTNEDMQPITTKVKIVEVSDTIKQMISDAETSIQVVEIFDGNKNLHSNKEFVNLIMSRKKTLKKNGI